MSDQNCNENVSYTPEIPRRRLRWSSSSESDEPPRKTRRSTKGLSADDLMKIVSALQNVPSKSTSSTNVIPEFDPNNESQDVERWIRKVNECAIIYSWDEKQTIHYALQKLCGLSKSWYESLPSLNHSWEVWQLKLKKAFPNDINFGKLLEEMLNRKSRMDESLREYFYDKLSLLGRCEIVGRKAVDCIIYGITDSSVRNGAQALQCKEPEDLLIYLASQQPTYSKENLRGPFVTNLIKKRDFRNNINNFNRNSSSSRGSDLVCYNCNERGHYFLNCSKPIVKCVKCGRVGHNNDSCARKPLQSHVSGGSQSGQPSSKSVLKVTSDEVLGPIRSIEHGLTGSQCLDSSLEQVFPLTISDLNNASNKFNKNVCVNGVVLNAYIDFGSDCSLIRVSDARRLNLVECNNRSLPIIRGFGDSIVNPNFQSTIQIRIDEVEAELSVLAVDDAYLKTSLLIGQNFTELESVTVLKDNESLFFYYTPSNFCNNQDATLNLFVTKDVTITKGGLVEVYTNELYTGAVYSSGGNRMSPNQEYHLHQGCYEVNQGKTVIFITSLTNAPIKFKADKLIARVNPVAETNTFIVQTDQALNKRAPLDKTEIKVGEAIDKVTHEKLYQLLQRYRNCFATNLSELGCASGAIMNIDLHDKTPVIYRPYRLSPHERQKVRDIVDDLIKNNIVQESDSNYASPILLVRKRNGESRLCVDYRALNSKTVKDKYPLPLIDDQLSNLSGNKLFITLDLASGYYQIPMGKDSRHLTAFVTPDGHYEFKRMPFGLANAPAVFQKMMNRLLGSRRFKSALAYMDDLLIPSATIDEGFERLEDVLKIIQEAGLTLNLSKCSFFDPKIEYLGYEISSEGIRPNERKIFAVRDFPVPHNIHEVRQFLGLASYFRRFVKGFGEIARPLTALLKKDVPWQWNDSEEQSYTTLKKCLIERPLLALYNPELDTEVHTDASSLGLGGILLQWQICPRVLKPVAYFSRQTAPEERHFHSYELETLAVVCSLKKFRPYLLGLNFTVYTDCNALRTTLTKRDLIPRIARWWLLISEYNFRIEYRPGCRMSHVDALSRNPPNNITSTSPMNVLNINTDNWILTLQMADPELQRIVRILRPNLDKEVSDIKKNYTIKNHSLHRIVGEELRLVVPKDARWQICKANHDDVGHFGLAKTLERINSRYWFPKLRRFVKKYVSACIDCAYYKDNAAGKRSGFLHPIEKVEKPFHTLHLDHLGPFVRSKTGNNYILTIVDGFTKYLFARAVKDTKTKNVVKVLENLFHDFGVPHRIVSDRGSAFTSSQFRAFCGDKGVKHILNAVACPRANGQAERFNQTILTALSIQNCGNDERDWDRQLGRVQWGINNTINATTKKSASELLFGINFNGPIDNMLAPGDIGVGNITPNRSLTIPEASVVEELADQSSSVLPEVSIVEELADQSSSALHEAPVIEELTDQSLSTPFEDSIVEELVDRSSSADPEAAPVVEEPVSQSSLSLTEPFTEIDKIRREASANIKLSQERQKASYDSKRSPAVSYSVGDLVKITKINFKNNGKSKKLLPKFIGPYKVTKCLGNDRYKISNIPGFHTNKYESVVAADRMRHWINVKALEINRSSESEFPVSDSDSSESTD